MDCLFLHVDDPCPVAEAAIAVLRDGGLEPCAVAMDHLESAQPPAHAEVGILAVPLCSHAQPQRLQAAVTRLRDDQAWVEVLALCGDWPCDADPTLVELSDELVLCSSPLAVRRVANFVRYYTHLRRARALRVFVDSAMDGYWWLDLATEELEFSERTETILGISAGVTPLVRPAMRELLHPDDVEPVNRALDEHLHDGADFRGIRIRVRTDTGAYRTFVINGEALRGMSGEALLVAGALTDVTDQHLVELQLAETRRRYETLFHHMNDAAVLVDPNTGTIVDANLPAEGLWGRSRDQLVGSPQTSLHPVYLSDETRTAFRRHVAQLRDHHRSTVQLPIERADGTVLPAEISSSLVEVDGSPLILGMFRDVSDRVEAEQAIRERDAQLQLAARLASMGSLAAGVGHEINNPLAYVLGNLTFVQSELTARLDLDDEVKAAIEEAISGAKRVHGIVQDLKSITRTDDSEQQCDPAEVVQIGTRMAMSDLRHRANVTVDVAPTQPAGVSASRLTQVLLNLLTNAAAAFDTSDTRDNLITVRVEGAEDRIRLTVTDNGRGIAAESLQRVFEPSYTTKPASQGAGLGLAICRRILDEVHGHITIESAEGLGTSATVELPLASADMATGRKATRRTPPAPQPEVQPVEPPNDDRPSIMVIDDDELTARVLERMLRQFYRVTVVRDAEQAVARLVQGEAYDLVLCDLMMPGLAGDQVHEALAERRPEMADRMMFVTGGAVTPESAAFESRMADEGRVLLKPVDLHVLRATVAEAIERLSDDGR